MEYVELGPGQYAELPDGLKPEQKQAYMQKALSDVRQAAMTKLANPTSGAEVLRQEQSPLSNAGSTLVNDVSSGVGNAVSGEGPTSSGAVNRVMGIARAANAPSAALGEGAGTMTQNLLAGIPGLGGAGGVVPAAGGAIANAVTQVASAGPLIKAGGDVVGGAYNLVKSAITGRSAKTAEAVANVGKMLGSGDASVGDLLARKSAIKATYNQAGTITKPVPNAPAQNILVNAYTSVTPDSTAAKALEEASAKLGSGSSSTPFNQVNEIQRSLNKTSQNLLRSKDANDLADMAKLKDAVKALKAHMEKTDPIVSQADTAMVKYSADEAVNKVLMNAAKPGVAFRNLMLSKPSLQQVYGLSPDQVDAVATQFDKVGQLKAAERAKGIATILKGLAGGVAGSLAYRLAHNMIFRGNTGMGGE